jgi:hypothetical protein
LHGLIDSGFSLCVHAKIERVAAKLADEQRLACASAGLKCRILLEEIAKGVALATATKE